jgi:hypothetical protein
MSTVPVNTVLRVLHVAIAGLVGRDSHRAAHPVRAARQYRAVRAEWGELRGDGLCLAYHDPLQRGGT